MASGISNIVSSVSIFLAGLLPASCHHQTAAVKPVAVVATNGVVVANPNLRDLGELTLTNHNEICVSCGSGKECILFPEMTDGKNAEITLTFETRMAGGKLQSMNVKQIAAQTGQPVQVAFDDFQLTFTPDIVAR